MNKVGTFTGIIIYHYDFKNKNNVEIKTTKCLFNINGCPVFINSTKLREHKIGSKVIMDIGYDGSKWFIV